MCLLTAKFLKVIEERFEGDERLEKPLEVKIRDKNNYTIGTANIYFKDQALFQELAGYAEQFLIDFARPNGEIQIAEVRAGKNIDLGIEQVRILDGKSFEVYCYECLSISFIRIILEEGLYYKQRWASIDIDELINTPWFAEDR